jgi:hypothetical protein
MSPKNMLPPLEKNVFLAIASAKSCDGFAFSWIFGGNVKMTIEASGLTRLALK